MAEIKDYMTPPLKHEFSREPLSHSLFEGTLKLSRFKAKLVKLSQTLPEEKPLVWGRHTDLEQNQYKIRGDGFELFCELLVEAMGIHPHIGLSDYAPIEPEIDEGIDAFAKNLYGEKCAVQCKFISDPDYQFTANGSNLPNFLVESTLKKIPWEEDTKIRRLFLLTTAKGLHYHTEGKWNDRVYVINGKMISKLTDNNHLFWNYCVKRLKETPSV